MNIILVIVIILLALWLLGFIPGLIGASLGWLLNIALIIAVILLIIWLLKKVFRLF